MYLYKLFPCMQVYALIYPYQQMGWSPTVMDPLTTDQLAPVLHTAVIMDILSLEETQGSVVMVGSGVNQLQCVNVSGSIHACTPGMEYDIILSNC